MRIVGIVATVLAGLGLGAAAVALAVSAPDIRRYLRISRM